MVFLVDAVGSVEMKELQQIESYCKWRVTLKIIWPQSQQEFEEELGGYEQDTAPRCGA